MDKAMQARTFEGEGSAVLSHGGGFSSFSFGGDVMRFATPLMAQGTLKLKVSMRAD